MPTETRHDDGFRTCEEMALARYEAGCKQGLNPEPWGRGVKENLIAGLEEAADGYNYAKWAKHASGDDRTRALSELAAQLFRGAFKALQEAQK